MPHTLCATKPRSTEWTTGGLHSNMTRALRIATERGAELAIFVQDDQQFVRDVTDRDIEIARSGFQRENASFVIQTCFLKSDPVRDEEAGSFKLVQPSLYERHLAAKSTQKLESFSDTGFYSIDLFNKQAGELLTGEAANEDAIFAAGKRMGFFVTPFMHWCPMPVSYRGKKRRAKDRFCDWLAWAGVHPIAPLSPDVVERMRQRDPVELPYARLFLRVPSLPPVCNWSIHGGKWNLRSRKGWRGRLGRLL